MPYDPKDHPQTQDFLGRQFTTPIEGGPVPGKLNLTVGEPKAGCDVLISLQDDKETIDLPIGTPDGPRVFTLEQVKSALAPLLEGLEPYEASQAYWVRFDCYVGDLSAEDVNKRCLEMLAAAGIAVQDDSW